MIPKAELEKQLAALNNRQIRSMIGRQRLRWTRQQIVEVLLAFIRVQENHGTGLAEWERSHKTICIGYTGLMKAFCALTPLLGHLASAWKQKSHVGLDRRTIVDSTLLATKEPSSIRSADWSAGNVTVRPGKPGADGQAGVERTCGKKAFCIMNSQRLIVMASLAGINQSDANYLKWPDRLYRQGLHGELLIDRGFDNQAVRHSIDTLNRTHSVCVKVIAPPRKTGATWSMSARRAYRPRWAIETFFQSVKATRGRYRLDLRGARHRAIHRARLATVVWAWNLNRYARIGKNRLRQQQRKAAAIRMAA